MTINDGSLPTINTYAFDTLAAIASYTADIPTNTLALTFTNGAMLTIEFVRDDKFIIGTAAEIGYNAFLAAVDTALEMRENTAPPATPTAQTVDEAATLTITAAMLGYADEDPLAKITITVIPTSGRLLLDGVAVTADTDVTATQLANGDLVYHPADGLKANADGAFTFTVNDGTTDSAAATLGITVTADDDAPVLSTFDNKITVSSGERLVLNDRFINAVDEDTAAASIIYTVSGTMPALLEKWDGSAWVALADTNTFTQADLDNGHVSILTTASSDFTITVSDGTTTLTAATINVVVRTPYTPPATTTKGDDHDLSGATAPAEVETGLGETEITGSAHDDKITGGLADDVIDLGDGGMDTVIYRLARQMTAVSSPGMAVTRSPASPPAMTCCSLEISMMRPQPLPISSIS